MSDHPSAMSRRGFLASSLSGLALAGLPAAWSGRARAEDTQESKAASKPEVIYRKLGRTGINWPVVGMGVMNANNPDLIRASYEIGVRHFDTAARYQYGRNEQMVGEVLKRLGVRDKVVIGTKELRPAQRGETTGQEVKTKLMELCEGSLRRLKTDYIDIFYIHSVSHAEDFTAPGIKEAIAELKKQGKIRAAGVSTHESMATVIKEVTQDGFYDVVLTAFNVAMAGNTDLIEAIAGAASKGVGIVAMKTQAGGARLPKPESLKDYDSSTIATASLKWVLKNENIGGAIPGYDNYEHMNEDFSVATGLEYTEEEERFLSDNRLTLGLGFCHQCRRCVPTCPRAVDVPGLMRTHMYAAQYANLHQARATLADIPPERGLRQCDSCAECTAACANAVDIRGRIADLKVIYG